MKVLTRAEWGARKPKETPVVVPLSRRTATAIHHDGATPIVVKTLDDVIGLIRRDQNFHMDGRGWNDIGYNFLVISAPNSPAIDGLAVEGRGRDVVGAHCANFNTPWVGIQIAVGGGQTPSPAALRTARALHDDIQAAKRAALDMKVHLDGFATECPGTFLTKWVRGGMQVSGVTVAASAIPTVLTKVTRKVVKAVKRAPLVVDGQIGEQTIRQWQRVMGTPVDGYISKPSSLVKAVQKRVGVTVDGYLGPQTWRGIQRRLGVAADGIPGPVTIKALQRRLNGGSF